MSQQLPLFNSRRGQLLRDLGIATVHSHNADWVTTAREVAVALARRNGTVVADDVRAVLYPLDIKPGHHNSWGAVFRDLRLEWTGVFQPSAVPSRHRNQQRVWRIKGA